MKRCSNPGTVGPAGTDRGVCPPRCRGQTDRSPLALTASLQPCVAPGPCRAWVRPSCAGGIGAIQAPRCPAEMLGMTPCAAVRTQQTPFPWVAASPRCRTPRPATSVAVPAPCSLRSDGHLCPGAEGNAFRPGLLGLR